MAEDNVEEFLKNNLSYDQNTGVVSFKSSRFKTRVGTQAGYISDRGYVTISHKGRKILAHRAAFFLMTGRWPIKCLDHINGIRNDNRWVNLRETSSTGNARNCAVSSNSTTGVRGVCYKPYHSKNKPWWVQLKVDDKVVYVGIFATKDEAVKARIDAGKKLHGEFSGQIIRGATR